VVRLPELEVRTIIGFGVVDTSGHRKPNDYSFFLDEALFRLFHGGQ
jgi:hypothetical protein